MRQRLSVLVAAVAAAAACSPRINIDLLGSARLEEVVLRPSPAAEKVLVVDVEGLLASGAPVGALAREGDVLSRVYLRLERAAADPLVKAVILRLDTPGGEVTASDILYHEILAFRERTGKPVIALTMGVAASGGYYAAMAADEVVAHPSSLVGSIGVISVYPSLGGLLDKIGVRMTVVKSGAMKDAGSPFRAMTDEERASFQAIVDEYYARFLAVVESGRKGKLGLEEIRPLADGRIYSAGQALRLKLVDGIGYFETAVERALARAGVARARIVAYSYYPKSKTNIYALAADGLRPAAGPGWDEWLPRLKSGFYFLWLPEIRD